MEHSQKMNDKKNSYITCKDHLVSNESFDLLYNSYYEMLETYPKPLAENISKYYQSNNYISHTDATKSITDKIYQWVKKYMLLKKLRFITSFKTPKTILDIGCGTGDFLQTCEKNGWKISGVEPEKKAFEKTKSKVKTPKNIYKNIEDITTQKFDIITLWHVLEHVPNVKEYIEKISYLLSDKGKIVIAVPNFKSYDAKHYKQFWAAYDVPRHLWHFSKKSIELLFQEKGFEIVKTKAMPFDAFYISLVSEKYKSENTFFIKPFFIGLLSNIISIWKKEPSSRIYVLKKK